MVIGSFGATPAAKAGVKPCAPCLRLKLKDHAKSAMACFKLSSFFEYWMLIF